MNIALILISLMTGDITVRLYPNKKSCEISLKNKITRTLTGYCVHIEGWGI